MKNRGYSGGADAEQVPPPAKLGTGQRHEVTREEHLKAIHIVGSRKVGKGTVLVMLCSGPECGGAEMIARCTAGDVAAEANAHVDKMADLGV